jgi:hypothetical protein
MAWEHQEGGGMTPAEIKAAAERYQNPYPRASNRGGKDHISPWVHKQEWEDLHKLANAMCDRIAADEIQRTQFCQICEARSKADESERLERDKPIDEAWIDSMAERAPESYWTIGSQYVIGERVCYFFWPDGTVEWELSGGGECCGATRGQLLDLLAALGIKPTN